MNLGLKEEVKVVVNSLLVPHSRGLTLDKLLNEYVSVEMREFPYKQLGHKNPADFLASIPDVVKFTRLSSGHVLLQAVANSKTGHIQELVKEQKNSKTASLKNYNRITQYNNHYQPPARRYPNPPMQGYRIGNRRGFQPTLLSAPPGRMTHSNSNVAENTYGRPTASQVVHINTNSLKAETPSSRTCSILEYESQLVSEFKSLFQSYPDGIDIAHVFALYSNKFKKEVFLHKIEPNLTSFTFFQRHGDVFRSWKRSGNTVVGLAGHEILRPSQLETTSPPPHADRGSLTGAVPKIHTPNNAAYSNVQSPTNRATPKFQSPTSAVPIQFKSPTNVAATPQSEDTYRTTNGNHLQAQWAASDIRTRIPGTKPLQTVIVGCRDSEETLARIVPQKLVPVPWHAPPRADEVLPDNFGVRKPKIKNVYEADIPVARQAFPANLADFDYFFLIVAEVYSPGEFYWFLSENRKPIENLTDDMTLFYSSNPEYFMSRTEMYIGQLVAAMYTDNLWYRARIVGCHQDLFQVFYVDYGSKNFVKLDRIRHLHLHFLKMPLQAFRGRIFGIQPLPHEPKWSFESGKLFLDLIKGCKIIAAAKMIEETLEIPEYEIETVYYLTLVDTTKEKDIHVSDYLIESGFALPCEEEQIAVVTSNSVYEYSTPSPSPAENTGIAPSPHPTCAFPSSAVNSVTSQLQTTSISIVTPTPISNNKQLDLVDQSIDELTFSERTSTNIQPEESVFASVKESLSDLTSERSFETNELKCVDVLVLKDERRLYTVEDGGELYLPKPDILMLIPSLDSQIAALKAKIDCKVVTAQTHQHIFADCAKAGAPWMKDDSLSELTLYSLQYVSLLFFLCSVKDKVASSAIEAKRKEFNNK